MLLKIKLDTQSNLVFSSQMTQQKNVPIYHKILLENYKINLETYKPIARLAGSNYSKLGEIFSIKR